MIRHAVLAVVGCGLIACANGTDQNNQKNTPTKAPAAAAPASKGESRLPDNTVIATWKGGEMTYGELTKDHASEFRTFRNKQKMDLFQFERERIEASVVQKLVQAAATAKGQTEQEYLKEQVGEATVTDEEVKQFHASNPQTKGQPLEQLAGRIKAFLTQQKQQQALIAVFDRLRTENEMKVTLPKVELAKASFDLSGRPVKGKADAKVTVVEFSDFECPFCSRAVAGVEAILKAYPDDVRVVFMHYPLSMHKNAMPAAVASQCANVQGKFWPFHDAVFASQKELTTDKFVAHAKATGIDVDKFKACLDDPKTRKFVTSDMEQGNKAGVQGTPAFFINGEPHQGVPTADTIKQYIEG